MPSVLRRTVFALAISLLAGSLLGSASASARPRHRHASSTEASTPSASEAGRSGEAGQAAPTPFESGTSAGTSGVTPPLSEPSPTTRPEAGRQHGKCTVSLEASASVVTAGETVTLLGRLACADTISEAGEAIVVYQREHGAASGLAEVATATTAEDGSFQLTSAPLTGKSVFVARSLLAHGGRTVVQVTPKITLDGPAADGAELATRAEGGSGRNRFTFSGSVSPAAAGARVALQREYLTTGEHWHTIAFGQVDDEGNYSISHGFRSPGEVSVRVVARPPGEQATASEPLTYDITQTENPQLTIQTSADPISSGAAATISGVAAGPAGQSLALLASTGGHAFLTAARGASEAGGAYSFTVTPSHSTTYKVISADAHSTPLFEGVRYALSTEAPAATAQTGVPVTFTGTVAPVPAGQRVYLERQNDSGAGFHVVAVATVDGSGGFSFSHAFDLAGNDVVRITVPVGVQLLGSTSPDFTIAVSGAPEPTGEA